MKDIKWLVQLIRFPTDGRGPGPVGKIEEMAEHGREAQGEIEGENGRVPAIAEQLRKAAESHSVHGAGEVVSARKVQERKCLATADALQCFAK